MRGDRIAFISEYCDRWCERCAFTERCSAYAVSTALGMCDGDFAAALELTIGAPRSRDGASELTAHEALLADCEPTEQQLAEIGKEMEERDERIDESPLTTDALVLSMLTAACLRKHHDTLGSHHDPHVREAFEIAGWDSHLIGAKLHRALDGQDEAEYGTLGDEDPVQNDWNGSAKVVLLSIERSIAAWEAIAAATSDADAAAIAHRLRALRVDVERTFPNVRKFVRPGFDAEQ
jgi:hypothetical protein